MNLIDAYVTEVLSEPRYNDTYANENVTWWEIEVEFDSYGIIERRKLTFENEQKAKEVKIGYHFLT